MTELRLKAVQAQMNPHFISNSLNAVQSFVLENDGESATHYLSKFARLTRKILEGSLYDLIALEDELEIIQLYLELEAMRYDGKLQFEIKTDPGLPVSDIEIPTMIIQPYVENAVIHGIAHKTGPGKIKVEFTATPDGLACVITDNGVGREKARQLETENEKTKTSTSGKRQSLGLNLINEKIALMNKAHQKDIEVITEDIDGTQQGASGTRVTVLIRNGINQKA